jgi:PKD repeat protein
MAILASVSGARSQSATVLINCEDASPAGGDQLDRGFYVDTYPGATLTQVDLWFSAQTKGEYQASLTVRALTYDGPLIGQDVQSFSLSGSTSQPTLVSFTFPAAEVQPGSTVTFAMELLSGPDNRVFYSLVTGSACPVIQTNGTTPPLDSIRRIGITVRIWGHQTPPAIPVPGELHVTNFDRTVTHFFCEDQVIPLVPSSEDFIVWWGATDYGGLAVDGYHYQIFEGGSCDAAPVVDNFWIDPNETSTYFGFRITPVAESYCYRVRAWVDLLDGSRQYGGWSPCCCFDVEERLCERLETPEVTGIGDTTCDGTTSDRLPLLSWNDVANESGYRWEVRTGSGALVSRGTTGENVVTTAEAGWLAYGDYVVSVQAYGDGEIYCDSERSPRCPFTVADVEGTADFTWWPEDPKQGERVRFADRSSGVPLTWDWDFDDGSASDGHQHPSHVFDQAGSYDVSLEVQFDSGKSVDAVSKTVTVSGAISCGDDACEGGETAWSCPSDCALEPEETGRAGGSGRRSSVPAAVGGVPGVGDTFWMTEGTVFNPGPGPVTFVLEYAAEGKSDTLEVGPFDLETQQGLFWENIVEDLFDKTGSGGLWLDSTSPVLFLTRSYNQTDDGSFGQGVAGTREPLTLAQDEGEMFLVGLREDSSFRSNLFFQEVDGSPVKVRIDVFNDAGEKISGATVPVDGHGVKLKKGSRLGISTAGSAYATVKVAEGAGRVAAIGSVIDNITGDPTTIDPIHPDQVTAKAAGENHHLVAVVAHTKGLFDSVWRSEVTIVNPDTVPQAVRMMYEVEYDQTGVVGDTLEESVTIQPGEQLPWEDVLVELFGIPANARTQGALHLYAPEGLIVNTRTYNQQADGSTLGQGVPALMAGDMIGVEETGKIMGLKHTPGTRTNVGFGEFDGQDTEVVVTFFTTRPGFVPLGSLTRTVPANSHLQITRVFDRLGLGSDPMTGIVAFVRVTSGGSVYAYGSVVDNATGDATTYLAPKN